MRLRVKDYTTKVGSGVTPKGGAETYLDSGIPLFRSQNVHDDGFVLEDIAYISEETDELMKGSRVKAGDVLLNITGASIGRCYFTSDDFVCGNVNQHVCIIRPKRKVIIPNYLHYLFISDIGQTYIDLTQTGANREGLTIKDIRTFSFDIPSLEKQLKIVEKLDAQLSSLDKRITALEKQCDAYARLKKSVIHQAVTRGLNPNVTLKDSGIEWIGMIPSHWGEKRIKDVASDILMGVSPEYEYDIENENLVFGQRNNQLYGIDFEGIKYAKDEFFKSRPQREFLKYGDVLLNTLGGGSVGRAGFYNLKDNVPVITDGHVMIIRSNSYYTKFLYYYLYSNLKRLELMAIGSTNQSFFNISDVREISIPMPPLSEQQEIANYLDEKCAKIDAAIENITKQIDASKRLRKAIINEAISGKAYTN